MISMLPGRVIRLLEFIGFSGNKVSRTWLLNRQPTWNWEFLIFSQQTGLQDLKIGYQMEGIRQVLCTMTLLAYNLIVCYVLSHQEGDLDFCDEVLNSQLMVITIPMCPHTLRNSYTLILMWIYMFRFQTYPNGVWFLFFKGRLEFMKGNLDDALHWYKKSWKSQNHWPQFHHLCFWEILWVNCLKLNWKEAEIFATLLCENSKWSRTIYTYQKAVVMLMRNDLTVAEQQTIETLMREARQYKQRIAGKSLPMEKFTIKKTERYFSEKKSLVLPAIELMYLWNAFKILGKNFQHADNVYRLIESAQKDLDARSDKSKYDADNRALILLLKGACLRQMKSPLQSLKWVQSIGLAICSVATVTEWCCVFSFYPQMPSNRSKSEQRD